MGMSIGGAGRKRKSTAIPAINITPLVDVVLVVLIIFMIVTPMVTKTFWLNLPPKPDKAEPAPSDNKPLVMTVDKAGVIRMNTTVLSKSEIRERVPRMLAAKDQKVLYFDAHNDASYAAAIEAMDLSRAGGVKSIAILTESVMK